jgi:uncharacterized repeat protein (TIGR03803 family)
MFSVNPATGAETVLYAFGSGADGRFPDASLVDVKGVLYGVTAYGGTIDGGTVFSITTTGTEKVLHSFGSGTDGYYPDASLIDVKGTLYGTTAQGGANGGWGTVFSLNPSTGAETVLHSFGGGLDGGSPIASLIDVKGTLYGTTRDGGPSDRGTVFALDPATGTETVVYSFCSQQNCTDGESPFAGLINVKGTLYGTTYAGGANYEGCGGEGCGTVFSLDPKTGAETVLYSFCPQAKCADGESPDANLIGVKGTLYGTTDLGGSYYDDGTVFSVNPKTGAETVIHSFDGGTGGEFPGGGLIDVKGVFYGTTMGLDGNTASKGTVFLLKK